MIESNVEKRLSDGQTGIQSKIKEIQAKKQWQCADMPDRIYTGNRNMKVALVHDWLKETGENEKILEMFCSIFPYAPIYTLFYEPALVSEKFHHRKIHASVLQQFLFTKDYHQMYLPLYPWAIEKFDLSGYDLDISTSQCAAKGVRIPGGTTHVCYCLSPMLYVWDKYDLYFGRRSRYSPLRLGMDSFRSRLREWDRRTADRVDYFIAPSQYVAKRIKQYYNRDSEVIPPPVDTDFFFPAFTESKRKDGLDVVGDYFLISSELVDHKNIDIAVEAFRNRPERLLVVGSGPEEKRLKHMAPENVQLLGSLSDQELSWLYQNCRAFIVTSEEDFGIVGLEAMSCGRPVITYYRGGVTETIEEGRTGMFFYDQSPESLSRALDKFEKTDMDPEEIHNHALNFSIQACFRKIKNFLQEKVGQNTFQASA